MKKIIIASFVFFAFTGNALACGEIPEVKASVKTEVLASKKVETEEVMETEVDVAKTELETSDAPEVEVAKADVEVSDTAEDKAE